jgi:hypothetical protein
MKEIRLIRWYDSYGVSAGWENLSDFHPNELLIESIGFVLYEDENIISLTGNYSCETDNTAEQANGIITIPKCCVQEMTTVSLNPC